MVGDQADDDDEGRRRRRGPASRENKKKETSREYTNVLKTGKESVVRFTDCGRLDVKSAECRQRSEVCRV